MSEEKNSSEMPSTLHRIDSPVTQISAYDAIEDLLQPKGPSLRDFVSLLIKRRTVILLTAAVVIGFGLLYAMLADDQFTANTTIEIRGYSPVFGDTGLESILQADTRKMLYQQTTIAKLTNLGLADAVLNTNDLGNVIKKHLRKQRSFFGKLIHMVRRSLGLPVDSNHLDVEDPRYVHRQSFINAYLRMLVVRPIKDTSLVQIRATTTDKRLSQRIANEHAEGLIRMLGSERKNELRAHLDLLRSQADELQQKLFAAESEVAKFAQNHKLVGIVGGSQGNVLSPQLAELGKLISTAKANRSVSESKLQKLSERKKLDTTFLDDETVRDIRTKLKEAEGEYSALSRLVTSEYPKLQEIQAKIDSYKRTIREQREENLGALQVEHQSDLAAEQLLIQQFEAQLNKAHEMSGELVQYNFLQREAASLRELTQSILKTFNETKIGASTVQNNVVITDYAPIPSSPSAPRRGIIITFSVVLGLLAGIGLALIVEVLDSTIKVSDEAQKALGLPTLGIIPSFPQMIGRPDDDREKSIKEKVVTAVRRLPWINKVGNEDADDGSISLSPTATSAENSTQPSVSVESLCTNQQQGNPLFMPEVGVLDALRTLRANILFSSTQNSYRVIMAASGKEREGKTSILSNLAVTFARASQRTLIIDADLRRPKVGRRFGIKENQLGLVDFLAGQASLEDVLVKGPVENLSIITAGSPTVNPTELLGSEKMARLIGTLKQHFDVILLDSAPVLPVADSLMLARLADTVIVVIRSGRTEKVVAQETLRRLRRVGADVRGVVMNDFKSGNGSYSSDRYSVSRYGVVHSTAKFVGDESDKDPNNQPKRAVG
jgi:capsular exopolysaccharide synthesis family protein